MTGIVADSSALVKLVLKERGWDRVLEVVKKRPYTLDLAFKEACNALWKRVVLLRDIDATRATLLLEDLLTLKNTVFKVESRDMYLRKAFEIAVKYKITIYDSLFIAQAHEKKAILATADKK